jgi:methylase of polypeptide subunit release factors
MSQRVSGYERKAFDRYDTPAWCTQALLPHLPVLGGTIWEPACGSGQMVAVLRQAGFDVIGTDIVDGVDFLDCVPRACAAIVSNPPYALATEFIQRALDVTRPRGLVAMLLRTDFDHAKTRQHLFSGCPAFAKKIVLVKRIIWFDGPKAAPSFNHAWYSWNHRHRGPPTLAYAP